MMNRASIPIRLALQKGALTIGFSVALAAVTLTLPNDNNSSGHVARAAPLAAGHTYVVNSTLDEPDADPTLSVCSSTPSGKCTLRAAVMEANYATGPNTITLPASVYVLTRPGYDDNALVGDLDIADDLTIQGTGSGVTIVDGNGAVTGDRVFQILPSAVNTSFSDLTIRNGRKISSPFDEGGGLLWEGGGGHLRLNNVIFEGNAASYGGGLYLDYSSAGGAIVIDNIIVRANTATAAIGGLGANFTANFGGFDMRGSRIFSNTAYEGGGLYF